MSVSGEEGRNREVEGVTGASTPAGAEGKVLFLGPKGLEMNDLPPASLFQGPLHIRPFLGHFV